MTQENLHSMRILIVDDEPVNVALLEDMLGFSEFTDFVSTTDPRQVLPLCRAQRPDLILLDLNMPFVDGFAVMRQLADEYPAADSVPILVLTADISVETKRRALSAGATDFLTKPFDPVEVILRINNLLRTRRQHVLLADQKVLLEEAVRERTAELEATLISLREAQGRMVQHERLSALGSMTAGIAHDFNNVLSLILGYSEMLRRSLAQPGGGAAGDALLGTVITAAQDAARMFGRLREFYRPADQGQARKMVDLNLLVEQAAELTRPKWHGQALGQGATIRLRTDLCHGLPPFLADAAELREMLTNLIFNAVDALPQGGEITLRTRAAARRGGPGSPGHGHGHGRGNAPALPGALLYDQGPEGHGPGLAMVYGTMQRHGGRIDLQSAPGQGTKFVFCFPVEAKVPEAATLPLDGMPQSLSILTVDDQPVLCEILAEHLTEDWHMVETAGDGREALEKFRAKAMDHPYDLVITDKAMPHMNGEQLAAAIKAMAPGTRVILLTGYGATNDGTLLPANIDMVVDKPVTRQALREAIARVMTDVHSEVALAGAVG